MARTRLLLLLQPDTVIQDLSEDLLYKILSHLDHIDHLKSTSMVCKQFHSLSNSLVHQLTLNKSAFSTYTNFQNLFKRLSCVKSIHINIPTLLDNAILAISNSDLNHLEKLHLPLRAQSPCSPETIGNMSTSTVIKGIKSLQLMWFCSLLKRPPPRVIKFIKMFPSLVELDLSRCYYGWTDTDIHEITSRLSNLRKFVIKLYDNDKILAIFCLNCPKLESVNFQGCTFAPEALYKFFCNYPMLTSVDMPLFINSGSMAKLVECIQILKNLNHLSIQSYIIQDAVLVAIAESQPPLKSLVIRCYSINVKYTMVGMSKLLSACSCLERLIVELPDSKNCNATDAEMSTIVKGLPYLKHIELQSYDICQATMFSLIQNCPLLNTIRFVRFPIFDQQVFDHKMERPTKINYSIKSIHISPKDDFCLPWKFELYCPNLKM